MKKPGWIRQTFKKRRVTPTAGAYDGWGRSGGPRIRYNFYGSFYTFGKMFPVRFGRSLIILLFLPTLWFSGCMVFPSAQFENHWREKDYAWLADQRVTCASGFAGCVKRHLLKGAACLFHASPDAAGLRDYECAAKSLQTGIRLYSKWEKAPEDHRFFLKLYCESLDRLFPLQQGETAAQTLEQMTVAAETLYRLSPESVAAVYYLSALHFHQMAGYLENLPPGDRPWVRVRLKRILNRVLTRQTDTLDPEWDMFAEKYDQLIFRLGIAVQAAACP